MPASRRAALSALALGGGAALASFGARAAPAGAARALAQSLGKAEARPLPDPLALLLSRTTYGAREEERRAAAALGMAGWIARQLAPESIPDPQVDAVLARHFPGLALSIAELATRARESEKPQQAVAELRGATLVRQLYSRRQLFEVVVEFWHDHFNTDHLDGPMRVFKTAEDRDVRAHAMGRFGELLAAVAKSPAMLWYLDNASNVVEAPNENYARELMELHTLGVDGGYTEEDVREVARIFTGWTIVGLRQGTGEAGFRFVPQRHDYGPKRVLGVDFPAGHGQDEGERLLALLASHPSTARFVATKLARRFLSDDPPAALVDAAAATFLASRGDICQVLATILRSEAFLAAGDAKVKRPLEFVLSAARVLAPATDGGTHLRSLGEQLAALGQLPFMWPAPNGYPDVAGYWINSAALLTRWNTALALAEDRIEGLALDLPALLGNARTPTALVDRLAGRVLNRPLAASDRATLVGFAAADGNAGAPLDTSTRDARARELVAVLLASDYFQMR